MKVYGVELQTVLNAQSAAAMPRSTAHYERVSYQAKLQGSAYAPAASTSAEEARLTLPSTLPTSSTSPAPSALGVTRTVRKGETLWGICKECLQASGKDASPTSVLRAVRQVAQSNKLADPDFLAVGQKVDLSVLSETAAAPAQPVAFDVGAAAKTTQQDPLPQPAATAQDLVAPSEPQTLTAKAAATAAAEAPESVGGEVTSDVRFQDSDVTAMIERILGAYEEAKLLAGEQSPWRALFGNGPARLTSEFGMRNDPFTGRPQFHEGLDIAAPQGTDILALKTGKVTFSGWDGGYGQVVVVEHSDGTETRYAHASKLLVKKGETVSPETPIARVGSTGRSTGPHLHFEYRVDGEPVNPTPHLQSLSQVASNE